MNTYRKGIPRILKGAQYLLSFLKAIRYNTQPGFMRFFYPPAPPLENDRLPDNIPAEKYPAWTRFMYRGADQLRRFHRDARAKDMAEAYTPRALHLIGQLSFPFVGLARYGIHGLRQDNPSGYGNSLITRGDLYMRPIQYATRQHYGGIVAAAVLHPLTMLRARYGPDFNIDPHYYAWIDLLDLQNELPPDHEDWSHNDITRYSETYRHARPYLRLLHNMSHSVAHALEKYHLMHPNPWADDNHPFRHLLLAPHPPRKRSNPIAYYDSYYKDWESHVPSHIPLQHPDYPSHIHLSPFVKAALFMGADPRDLTHRVLHKEEIPVILSQTALPATSPHLHPRREGAYAHMLSSEIPVHVQWQLPQTISLPVVRWLHNLFSRHEHEYAMHKLMRQKYPVRFEANEIRDVTTISLIRDGLVGPEHVRGNPDPRTVADRVGATRQADWLRVQATRHTGLTPHMPEWAYHLPPKYVTVATTPAQLGYVADQMANCVAREKFKVPERIRSGKTVLLFLHTRHGKSVLELEKDTGMIHEHNGYMDLRHLIPAFHHRLADAISNFAMAWSGYLKRPVRKQRTRRQTITLLKPGETAPMMS